MYKRIQHLFKLILISFFAILGMAIIIIGMASKDETQAADTCSTKPVSSTAFIKTHHLRDDTDGFGIATTKDGGYLLTGETVWSGGMQAPYPYAIRINSKGDKVWTKDFSSPSNALGDMSSSHFGRLAVETSDGNVFTASDVVDFVDESKKEIYGDILVTKINSKGTQVWSLMIGDYSIDRPQKMWALSGGGVMLLARFMKTGYGDDVADTDAVPKYSVLIEIDKNGKVRSVKKMDWNAVDMERLADGAYIALANIKIPQSDQLSTSINSEVAMTDIPTIIKLGSDLNVKWAKSLEMIPSELSNPILNADGTISMGKIVMRLMGGDFRSVQPAPDGGFLVFGFTNQLLTQGLYGSIDTSSEELSLRPYMAVKVDASGNYKWAKKLTIELVSGGSVNDFHVAKTTDGYYVIMKNVVRDSAGIDAKTQDAAEKRKIFLEKCTEYGSDCLNEENLIPELQPYADASNDAMKVLADASTVNIGLVKIDSDFNPMWIKRIDTERELSGYGIKPTADKGVAIVGSMLTDKMHWVLTEMVPYTEAALIKVDTNGSVSGCTKVTNYSKATLEDQSQYLVMQNMSVTSATNTALNINKKVKEKVATAKNTVRDICKYQKISVAPVCSYLTFDDTASTSTGQTGTTPTAKTWALINYENAKEVAIDGEKNISINAELLPILNQVFGSQIKMTDSMKSMWLTYVFSRLVTRADVESVQKEYEELGYKVDESHDGILYVSKIGLTLHMTFSTQDSMIGKLEVLF